MHKRPSSNQNLIDQHYPQLSDVGNAHRFQGYFSHLVRFVPTHGWYIFCETHWEPASSETMLTLARESLEDFLDSAQHEHADDPELCTRILAHLSRSESLPRLHALLHLASTLPELILPASSLDADPYLFNLRNGTLDLRSGTLLPHTRNHYLTHLLPYDFDPSATSPIWETFLDRLTNSDTALQHALQRTIGSTLFGASLESTCFLLTGPGQRAHHLFLSTLRHLLGSYACHTLSLQPRALTPTLLTSRLLTLASSTLLHEADPAVLSALLNHDPLALPTSPDQPFQPHTTLWLSAPEIPQLSSELASLREYLQPIPLSLSLTSYEAAQLALQLQQALPAILNWALAGFQHWSTEAPIEPTCLQEAHTCFQEDQDPIARFLAQGCTPSPDHLHPALDFYQNYLAWARLSGERPLPIADFSSRLHALGITRTRSSRGRFYHGFIPLSPNSSSIRNIDSTPSLIAV